MDSFEILGGIGSQQFDSLKPPGSIYRETFDTARMGMESRGGGGGGGGGSQVDHESVKEQWRYQNRRGRAATAHEIEKTLAQQRNENWTVDYRNRAANMQYQFGRIQNRFQNDARQNAYRMGKLMQKHQYELNADAARLAAEGANLQRYEREIQNMLGDEQDNIGRYMAYEKLHEKRAELIFKRQNKVVEHLKEAGKVRGRGQEGVSIKKQINDTLGVYGRFSSALGHQMNSVDSQFNLEMTGFDVKKIGRLATEVSILKNWQHQYKTIELKWKQADLQNQFSVEQFAPPIMPDPLKPEPLQYAEYVMPLAWEDIPEPGEGVQMASGGVSTGGGGWGAGLAAVGGMMTAASALPIATVGGVSGSALGAASGFGFLGPAGLILSGAAIAGSLFGWW
tara:strand:- start:1229 stop:2413 length:1185 start_codon:yes stop_codon:yes gene_type:complete